MPNPNEDLTDGTSRKGHPATPHAKAPKPTGKPAPTPSPNPVTPEVRDVPEPQMPTGEVGVRNQPGPTLASSSGGTSKAEDTSRAAGYVADLTRPSAAPPGPPIGKTPENFAGQSGTAPAPGRRPEKATPNTTPPTPPSPPTPDPTTPVPERPPADAPPETDRPIQLPAPKDTIRPPKPNAPGRIARAKDQAGKVGARDGSSRGSSHRDEGTVSAVRSLISSFEQIMKEIPRGAAARFDGVTDELAKARKSLDQGTHAPQASAPGQHAGSPKPIAASPQGHPHGSGAGRDRAANLKDVSSDGPSAPAAL